MTPPSPTAPVCPHCGSRLAAGVPLGLCRSCIAAAWLENPGAGDEESGEGEFRAGADPAEGGVSFAGFELREQLGRGGMGVVFRAWQPALQREVALKLVSAGRFAGAEEFQRLRLEAGAVARLSHPNIVSVFEAGEQDGQPWLAMQFVPGGPLSRSMDQFTGRPREAARLMAQIAAGVHHAHQHGVLHRDLKPGNILMDAEGHPLVGDFGLARLMDGDEGVTMTGRTVGSPAYMAPEAFRGEASVARDVYALGVVLYQILTGRLPFEGPDSPSLIRRCMEEEPPRLRALRPDIPRDLEVISLRCLEKNPAHRYASAQDLADDLHNWLEHRPIRARPVSLPVKAWKWCRRHPGKATAAAAAIAALGGLGVHRAHLASVQRQADEDLAKSQRESLASLRRAGLESALREIESGYLDQARRVLDDVKRIEPAGAAPSPEWAWLRARCRTSGMFLVQAHQGEITAAAFSADGQWLATAGQDALIHLWKIADFTHAEAKPAKTLSSQHRSAAIALGFTADGSQVFAARNGSPRVMEWIPVTGDGSVRSFTVQAPAEAWLQSAGLSGKEGRALVSFNGHAGPAALPKPRAWAAPAGTEEPASLPLPVQSAFLATRPDTSEVLTGDFLNGLHLLQPGADGAWTIRWKDPRPLYSLTALTASRSGRHVAAAHTAATGLTNIQLIRTGDGTQFTLSEPSGTIRSLAMAGDEWMAAGGDDRVVRLWNLDSPSSCYALAGHMRPVRAVAFDPAGTRLASGDQGGKLALSDVPRSAVPAAGAPVAVTPDLSLVAACGYRDGFPARELVLAAPRTGTSTRLVTPATPAALRLEGTGGTLLCQDENRVVRCTLSENRITGEVAWPFPAACQVVAIAPAGDFFASRTAGAADITLKSHHLADGKQHSSATLTMSGWSTVQFAPDGRRVFVLDAPAGRLACHTFPELTAVWEKTLRPQTAVAVSPDGTRVAWAAGFRAGVLDAATGEESQTEMRQPCEVISRLIFAGPDHLMLSSYDNSILFISLATGQVTLESRRHPACSELMAARDFSLWMSIDLQNRLGWFPWTSSPHPAAEKP